MAVAESSASFKTIAGGDTSASIKDLGLKDKINFICSGGGVLLEMLIKPTSTSYFSKSMALKTTLPIRPKPLIPITIFLSFVIN
jgi:hypothetical protein